LRTKAVNAQTNEVSEPIAKLAVAPTQLKVQDVSKSLAREEHAKPVVEEEPSPAPPKVRLQTPPVDSVTIGNVPTGSFRKDEVASLKAQVEELQKKFKERDHMDAALNDESKQEARRAKTQEQSLDLRLSKLEKKLSESQRQVSSDAAAASSQDGGAAPASAELMRDVEEVHGLVQEAQAKLRGMSQQIGSLKASVSALSAHSVA
jgi:hypothetical protein